VQQILATELPGIPLWYPNVEVVHSTRLTGVTLNPGGTFDFCGLRSCNKAQGLSAALCYPSQMQIYFSLALGGVMFLRRM
jgi:hypothetical protein